ncbi:MAG: helix-turn-helix transcriptional regulator [Alphaproteobacteria bacterium]|nr:helix-turn-helix transcriptional regulator [Alphaproteobacteria bacterium]MBF0373480.1 helix-turn-helix transcriptional regulator [Alphaproteobacteria bacterium]
MLHHGNIWSAIDRLARERGLTASALARRAGLDPTTFNRSKRISREGKPRWPSTESLAKVLEATSASLAEFMGYLDPGANGQSVRNIPLIRLGNTAPTGQFDERGGPDGAACDEAPFPEMIDPKAFAVEIEGDTLHPIYRDGDRLVVSPAAELRRGDRVMAMTAEGRILVRILARRTARKVDLAPLCEDQQALSLGTDQLRWIHRILWASQ